MKTTTIHALRIPKGMEFRLFDTSDRYWPTCGVKGEVIRKSKASIDILLTYENGKLYIHKVNADKVLEIGVNDETWWKLVEGIAVNDVAASHLSDAQQLIALGDVKTANQKINFAKHLLFTYKNGDKLLKQNELDEIWNKVIK